MTRSCPAGSGRRGCGDLESGTNSPVSALVARAMGTLAQKTDRHPASPVRAPPTTGPRARLRPNTPSHTPMARARLAGVVNVLVMMPSAAGLSMAAPTPCMTRKVISHPRLGARLHSHEARANADRPTWKILRRPTRSARVPELSRHEVSATVYAATVHCRPLTGACRSRPMDGRATLTMVVSSPVRNRLVQQMPSISPRRLGNSPWRPRPPRPVACTGLPAMHTNRYVRGLGPVLAAGPRQPGQRAEAGPLLTDECIKSRFEPHVSILTDSTEVWN